MLEFSPLLVIFSVQVVVFGSLAFAAQSWIRRQKDPLKARAHVLRLIFWFMVAVTITATAGQVFMYATGRSSEWLPHPTTIVLLPLVGIIYVRASRAAKSRPVR